MGTEVALRTGSVALGAQLLRNIEHDREGEDVMVARELHERLARVRLDVRRVHDRELPELQALPRDEVEDLEGLLRHRLVVLVVADEPAAEVGAQDLGRREVLRGERRLPRSARADQDDEGELRELDLRHRENTASCVGAPTSASSSPTGRKRAV